MIKKCKYCGETFVTDNKNKQYCDRKHYKPCPICGKSVYISNKYLSSQIKCCSNGCSKILRQQKFKKKSCVLCNKEFTPNSGNQIVCNVTHYDTCEICGKSFVRTIKNLNEGVTTCCRECTNIKLKRFYNDKYGVDHPMQCAKVQQKFYNSMLKTYGVKHALQIPEKLNKSIDTTRRRYGVLYGCMTKQCRDNNPISQANRKFIKLLENNNIQYETEYPIDDRLYDFRISNSNLLVEINPTYTHTIQHNHWGRNFEPNYHINKSKLAESHGYRCIHIWDWDDWDNMIKLITPIKHKIPARKCEVYKLHKWVGDDFLKKYHLQGICRGQLLYLGLIYGGTLLQVMTLGGARYNKSYDVELMRMCTLPGYSIMGGASKLLHFATQYYGLDNIITYCDRSKFCGEVYGKIGMKLSHTVPPTKIWSKDNKYVTDHLLKQYGYNKLFQVEYDKSNEELMVENGWLPVYDCGKDVYVYRRL